MASRARRASRRIFPRSAGHCPAKTERIGKAKECRASRAWIVARFPRVGMLGATGAERTQARVGSDPLIAPQTGCRGRQPLQRRTERRRESAGGASPSPTVTDGRGRVIPPPCKGRQGGPDPQFRTPNSAFRIEKTAEAWTPPSLGRSKPLLFSGLRFNQGSPRRPSCPSSGRRPA